MVYFEAPRSFALHGYRHGEHSCCLGGDGAKVFSAHNNLFCSQSHSQQYLYSQVALFASGTTIMDTNQRPERPEPDPHFERLHGPPLSYARSIQSFLQAYDPQPAPGLRGFSAETSGYSRPTLPNAIDFTKGKAPASTVPPPPTASFLSGFQTPYESACSIVNCESGCNPSVVGSGTCSMSQCNNLNQCTSEECCREPACLDHSSLPTTRRESIDVSVWNQFASSPSQHQVANSGVVSPAYDNLPGFDNTAYDSLQCHWLLPDQECEIAAPTNDALSKHVYHDHIEPETSIGYGSSEWVGPLNAHQPMWNSDYPERHAPDSYVCLWDACMDRFSDTEQLKTHMEAVHTQMESIDCRWGGCGCIIANSAELQSHVEKEHLHLHTQQAGSSSDLGTNLSENRSSKRRNHPLYWTPEMDDLLLRVRAQNLSYPQIASQFFPDKSAKALQCRYIRLYDQRQQSDPQPTVQSAPFSSYTPLQPASPYTGPYESPNPSVVPSSIQVSPVILSQPSSQLVVGRPQTQGDHVCMWITGNETEMLCGTRFGNSNALQAHVESTHCPSTRKRKPKSHWVCKWSGCVMKGITRESRDKLWKHICSHTGCKSIFVMGRSLR